MQPQPSSMASTIISQTCSVELLVWDHILVIPWMWFHWLQHPLSDWQPNFSQDFTWGWQICLQILTLFQYHNNTWVAHLHFWQYLDCLWILHQLDLHTTMHSPGNSPPYYCLHTLCTFHWWPCPGAAPLPMLIPHTLQLNTPPAPCISLQCYLQQLPHLCWDLPDHCKS